MRLFARSLVCACICVALALAASSGRTESHNRPDRVLTSGVWSLFEPEPPTEPPVIVQVERQEPQTTQPAPTVPRPQVVWPVSLQPCGGDLPPCSVKQAESHGDYSAFNPTGCSGFGCYGAWQLSGAWAGRLGLPLDLSQATPEQQDNAARLLWAGGAGCANWAAC